jgi:protein-S-isoprenylcysteine O-methyltransferase Ste14
VILLLLTIFLPEGENPGLRAAGVFILALSTLFIFLPFYHLGKYGQAAKGESYTQSRQVVERGLYAIVRHPQYLGYVLLGCGFAFLRQHWVIILLAVLGAVFFYLQVEVEENACLSKFGGTYRRYCQRVPRFNFVLGLIRALICSSRG